MIFWWLLSCDFKLAKTDSCRFNSNGNRPKEGIIRIITILKKHRIPQKKNRKFINFRLDSTREIKNVGWVETVASDTQGIFSVSVSQFIGTTRVSLILFLRNRFCTGSSIRPNFEYETSSIVNRLKYANIREDPHSYCRIGCLKQHRIENSARKSIAFQHVTCFREFLFWKNSCLLPLRNSEDIRNKVIYLWTGNASTYSSTERKFIIFRNLDRDIVLTKRIKPINHLITSHA